MYYSNREIYDSYMTAKNRTEQMKILMQLNLCSKENIAAAILEEFEHRKQNGRFLDAAKEREAERAVKQIKIKTKTETKEPYVAAATYGSLPLELRQHIYQRVCENCTYKEFLELTELPEARTTRISYQNLKQKAIREGFSVSCHPFCDVPKRDQRSSERQAPEKAAGPDNTETDGLTHGTQLFGDSETQTYYNKLKEYEDLEKQGKLLKLLYAVGDTVYVFLPNDSHFTKAQVNKIEIKPTIYGKMCYFIEPVSHRGHLCRYFEGDFGKTVFPTEEAALQKMKEMERDTLDTLKALCRA